MSWPISNHGSTDVDLIIPNVTAPAYLWAMLSAEGEIFRGSENAGVRRHLATAIERFSSRVTGGQAPRQDISDQRLRTWKSEFEEMGLLTVHDDIIAKTRFGRAVIEGVENVAVAIEGANRRIALLGAQVANRVLLAKPGAKSSSNTVPDDADLLPLRAIWRAFRELDNKLHWQDINRVLGHIHYASDLDAGIEKIRAFRATIGDQYPLDELGLAKLGDVPLTDDPRHITPWFNRAGIGGMLIPSEADANGFRQLEPKAATIIDALLGEPEPEPNDAARTNRQDYVRYLMAPVEIASRPPVSTNDQRLIDNVTQAVNSVGDRRIIVLSGLPGTGKSRLARKVADQLTDGDNARLKEIQFHENTTYADFMEGFVPKSDGNGFERRDKVFRVINQRALDNPHAKHVLLIEELTRANVHAVIGELLTFVEHRSRNFTLSLSQQDITIAPNLVILATMNPRDKSALSLDDAISRRLHRVDVKPSVEGLRSMLAESLDAGVLERLCDWYSSFQNLLPFGHGVFAGATDEKTLAEIWRGTVIPMLSDPRGLLREAYRPACENFPFLNEETNQSAV